MKSIKNFFVVLFFVLGTWAVITYIANVVTIGDKVGVVTMTGKWGATAFDILFIFGPLVFLAFLIYSQLLRYQNLAISDPQKMSPKELDDYVKQIVATTKDENSTLRQYNMAAEAERAGRNTTSFKRGFVKQYLEKCDDHVRKSSTEIALLAAVSIVISPQSFGDRLCMLFWNCKMISRVLAIYGVRPSLGALCRLYVKVLFASFMVGSIDDVMDNIAPGGNSKIPLLSQALQALSAAFAIFKTASITRYLILNGMSSENLRKAKSEAIGYAAQNSATIFADENFQKACGRIAKGTGKAIADAIVNAGKAAGDAFKGAVGNVFHRQKNESGENVGAEPSKS